MDMSKFGEYLTQKLREHGISQSQLSYRSGISDAHICRLSKEERGLPKLETLVKISRALRISLKQMLRELGYLEHDVVELAEPLQAFLQSDLCPPGITLDEIEALASHSNYEGGANSSEAYAKVLDEIRERPEFRIHKALNGQPAVLQEAIAKMVEAYVKSFGDSLEAGS